MSSPESTVFKLRVVYAFFFAVYGALLPFLPIIFHAQHFTDSQTSLCFAAMGLAAMIPPLITGHVADRILPAQRLLSILLIVGTFIIPLFLWSTNPLTSLVVNFLFFVCFFPAASTLDALTLHFISLNPGAANFPAIRVWGTIGFIVPSLLLLLAQHVVVIDSRTLIIVATSVSFGAALSSFLTPPIELPKSREGLPSLDALKACFQKPVRDMIIGTTISGIGLSMFYVLFSRYLQELGYSIVDIGLITNIGVLCEALYMTRTHGVTERVGLRGVVLIAMASVGVRLLLLGLAPTTSVIIGTQALHAPIVMGFFVAAPMFISKLAKDSYRFSMQGTYMMLMFGTSRITGTLLMALIVSNPDRTAFQNLRMAAYWGGILGCVGLLWTILAALMFKKTSPTAG